MNLIDKAIADVTATIPREVLRLAYLDEYNWQRESPYSIEEQIRRKTIYPRVLVDCNIVGGQQILVDIDDLEPEVFENNIYVYTIPGERVAHRNIMTVLEATYLSYGLLPNSPMPGYQAGRDIGRADMTNTSMRLMNSNSSMPIISTSDCEVIGHNKVRVRGNLIYKRLRDMRVIIDNEEELSNIPYRSALEFSRLVQMACKSYIYTNLLVRLDKGYLENGQELPSIKNYHDSLSDSETNYATLLERWSGIAMIVNDEFHRDLIRLQIPMSI